MKIKRVWTSTTRWKKLKRSAGRWLIDMAMDGASVIEFDGYYFLELPGENVWGLNDTFDVCHLAGYWRQLNQLRYPKTFVDATEIHKHAVLEAARILARPPMWELYISASGWFSYKCQDYSPSGYVNYLQHCAGVSRGFTRRINLSGLCNYSCSGQIGCFDPMTHSGLVTQQNKKIQGERNED